MGNLNPYISDFSERRLGRFRGSLTAGPVPTVLNKMVDRLQDPRPFRVSDCGPIAIDSTAIDRDRSRSTRTKPSPVASVRIGSGAARCTPRLCRPPRAAGGADSARTLEATPRCVQLRLRHRDTWGYQDGWDRWDGCSDAQALKRSSGAARPPPRGGCRFSGGGVHGERE